MSIINHATKNIIPFLVSPAKSCPKPGMMKDKTAASIGFTIIFPL